MPTLSPEMNTLLMFGSLLVLLFLGFPLAFVLTGIGLLFGVSLFGLNYAGAFILAFLSTMKNYILLAIPLFVFMGAIMQYSDVSDRLFGTVYVLFGKLRGGLAITSNILSTIFAACTGVVGASVVTVGLLSMPPMLKRNYDKKLIAGIICAGGCLGVLIPPSIMVIVYGPAAGVSVGKLFMGLIGPGLLLSALYTLYIVALTTIFPEAGPPISKEDLADFPWAKTRRGVALRVLSSLVAPLVIILAVLGTIFFGVASPTEAAGVGAAAAIALAFAYKKLNMKMLVNASDSALKTTCMILTMTVGAVLFVSTFMSMGGGAVVERFIMGLPFGKWGIFFLMFAVVTILGMFLDWIGIVLLIVPLFTPIAANLGFDPVWFSIMMILFLQLSYLTPPFALAIFYFKGICPPEITTMDIYKGVVPFIAIQLFAFTLCILFPGIILWLPSVSVTGW